MGDSSANILFQLLRAALGNEAAVGELSSDIDWQEVIDLSFDQGVAAIAVDGLGFAHDNDGSLRQAQGKLSSPQVNDTLRYDNDNYEGKELALDSPELEDLKYEWFGEVFSCEEDYQKYKSAIINLAKFYESIGVRMMLLKGYGLSLNYPIPEHRPTGDIDIYLSDWKRGDEEIEKKLGIKVDRSHEHHTVFQFECFTVENHYDIVNTKEKKSSVALDATLKRLAEGAQRMDEGFYLPSADFNAIFVIRHLGQHIAGERVTLRQLLDWGLFIEKHSDAIDWDFVTAYWQEIGISEFARCINRICVDSLGFDARRFHGELSDNAALCVRLLSDILHPEFDGECPQGSFLKEALFKTRRYIANGWKRKLVYKEGLIEAFVTGAFAKLKRRNVADKTM